MKKFICISCGTNWYSSHDDKEPCQRCKGLLVEGIMNRKDLERVEEKEETECITSTETI